MTRRRMSLVPATAFAARWQPRALEDDRPDVAPCYLHGALTVALLALVALFWPSSAHAATVGPPTTDANGVLHYPVTSTHEANTGGLTLDLRVLPPKTFDTKQRRFLFMLPVEPYTSATYGDPLDTIRGVTTLDAMHLIVVVPAFSATPWYADNPTDPTLAQETYLLEDILPAVESLYPASPPDNRPPRRMLLGFSKSGMGALSLLLRHSAVFDAAAAWDAPIHQTALSSLPGMAQVYGTQANFANYAIPKLLPMHAAEFGGLETRIWIGGYSSQGTWRNDVTAAHAAMQSLGIQHVWADGPQEAHMWSAQWVSAALAFLDRAAPATDLEVDAGAPDAGTSDAGASSPSDAGGSGAVPSPHGGSSANDGAVDASARADGTAPESTSGCACRVGVRRGAAEGVLSWPVGIWIWVARARRKRRMVDGDGERTCAQARRRSRG